MSAETIFTSLDTAAVCFTLSEYHLLSATGPDSERYLQGRLTQDVKAIAQGTAKHSLLLTPQGKILSQCLIARRLIADSDGFLIIADPGNGEEAFIKDLLQFKVADQLEVESLRDTHCLLSVIGAKSMEALSALEIEVPGEPWSAAETSFNGQALYLINNPRGSKPGFDIVLAKDNEAAFKQALAEKASVTTLEQEESQEAFTMLRIAAKIPLGGTDLTEKIQATDVPIEHLVSFEKGCYAGQEVVEMSIARGRPNRALHLLSVPSQAAITAGTEVQSEGKKCGVVSSSCFLASKGESLCLAFIKTSIADDAALSIGDSVCKRL